MGLIYAFMRGVTRLNEFVGRWAAHLILAISFLLILEVFLRYSFRAPTVWTNELAQLLFGAYAVLSGGYILAHGGHVNVDIIHSKFTVRTRAIIDLCTSIFFFLFAIVLLIQGSLFAFESIQKFESSQSAWNPSIWVFKAAIPVGAALLLLQGIVKLIQDIFLAAGTELPSDLRPGREAKKEAAGDVL